MKNEDKKIKAGVTHLRSMSFRLSSIVCILLIVMAVINMLMIMLNVRGVVHETVQSYLADYGQTMGEKLDEMIPEDASLVDTGLYTNLLEDAYPTGINGSYSYLVNKDGTMLYHKTAEKIGQPVENSVLVDVIGRIAAGEQVESFLTSYQYKGSVCWAYVYVAEDMRFVYVTSCTEANYMADINDIRTRGIITNIIVVAIFGLIIIFVMRYMTRPLKEVAEEINTIKELDFTSNPTQEKLATRKDEIGVIGKAIDELRGQLSEVILMIQTQSRDLYRASEDMNAHIQDTTAVIDQVRLAVHEVANRATMQAQDTQQTTQEVGVMGEAVEDASNQVQTLFENTGSVRDSGDRAVSTLHELRNINENVKVAMKEIYEQTNMTNESVGKIGEATTLITSIAEETNLLSLNASIEAARAGEQGRGFAVVAGQIQKLAEQSNNAAVYIGEIISNLTEESNKAVSTMQNVMKVIDEQNEKVESTEVIVGEVSEKIGNSIDGMNIIATSTKNIDNSRGNVIRLVQNLYDIAQDNAANSEESSAAVAEASESMNSIAENTRRLEEIAKQMEESMDRFKL